MFDRARLALYLVTDARLPFADLVAGACAAVQGGVGLVQYRNPAAHGRQALEEVKALMTALAPFGVPVIVNDRVDVALAAGAAGVHVGQADLPAGAARALLGPGAIVGLSITAIDQIASVDRAAVDYLGIGPVFPTGSKEDAAPALGLEGTAAAVAACASMASVAIGGISAANAAAVRATGVGGLAVISAIYGAADRTQAARQLLA